MLDVDPLRAAQLGLRSRAQLVREHLAEPAAAPERDPPAHAEGCVEPQLSRFRAPDAALDQRPSPFAPAHEVFIRGFQRSEPSGGAA